MKISRKALDKLLDGLGLKEFTADQLAKLVDFLTAGSESDAVEAAPEPAAAADLSAPTVALADDVPMADEPPLPTEPVDAIAALMERTGLASDALQAALLANVDAIVSLLTGDPTMAASAALTRDLAVDSLRTSLVTLTKEVNGYKAEAAKVANARLEIEVDALIKAGKIHPSKKAETVALARKAPAEFRALSSMLSVSLPTTPHAAALTAPTPTSEGPIACTLPLDHPKVVTLSAMLTAARAPKDGPIWRDAMARLTP